MDFRINFRLVFRLLLCTMLALIPCVMAIPVFAADTYTIAAEDALIESDTEMLVEPDSPPFNIGGWKDDSAASFEFSTKKAGSYEVVICYSKQDDGIGSADMEFTVSDAEDSLGLSLPPTGEDWSNYEEISVGSIWLPEGDVELTLAPTDPKPDQYLINLRFVRFTMEGDSSDEDASFIPPEQRLYDDAGLFFDSEKTELNIDLGNVSAQTGAHFIILTTNEDVELEDYSYQFFDTNIRGEGGINDCVILSVNMSTRRVAIDCFGELRSRIADEEINTVREALTPDMEEADYNSAAQIFLSDMSAIVKQKYALYNMETPKVDPTEKIYDFANRLSLNEREDLQKQAKDLSDKTGLDYVIAILDEYESEEYLQGFASSFYRQNFKEGTEQNGIYMLVIACGDGSDSDSIPKAIAAPFGIFDPENDVLNYDSNAVELKLYDYSVFTGCASFLSIQQDRWLAEHIELPAFNSEANLWDYGDLLPDVQAKELNTYLQEKSEEYGTQFYLITTPYSTYNAAAAFTYDFWDAYYDDLNNCILLILHSPPEVEGDSLDADLYLMGTRPYDKLGDQAQSEIRYAAAAAAQSGDYQLACEQYVAIASKALNSWIPKAVMASDFPKILARSFLLAVIIGFLVVIILRIAHNFGGKRKVSAGDYLAENSLSIYYSNDLFVSTHTTQRKIESESSSGGGSSSSGGGHSSRSEGSF